MRNVIYYVATSLDGFIARKDGGVDWLYDGMDFGFETFLESVDTIIQGRRTYEQVLTFGDWPYGNKESYVFSKTNAGNVSQHALFVDQDIPVFIDQIKALPGKDIWLIGGSELAGSFLKHDCIDIIWIFVHPVLLGEGIPLFPLPHRETWFDLEYVNPRNKGVIEMKLRKPEKM